MVLWKKAMLTLLASTCMVTALLPASASADISALRSITASAEETESEPEIDKALVEQIRETAKVVKKRMRVKVLKGKCGKYVNHQLVVLGINKKYIACNGNREYDIYYKKSASTGGYTIRAYGAKKYSLKSALNAIAEEDPNARNILVGFQKGTSKAGKKYGHTLLIHGIENGMVYFSDTYAQTVDGVRYKAGTPIVCSIDTFAKQYKKYKLDGLIWFS